jgi:very-short-patch-repair endonuclease
MLRITTQKQAKALGVSLAGGAVRPIRVAGVSGGLASLLKGSTPHRTLWDAVNRAFSGRASLEYSGAVPGRRFRLDIAFVYARLPVEVDGWEHHGKFKADFTRDRVRQNLLTLYGWRILRFTAGQIRRDTRGCIETIRKALTP